MDVTKETFPAISNQISEFIRTCEFYAVDTELTGVSVPSMPEGLCDTPERNYALKGTAATRYSIIQFGLCTFHRDPQNPKNFITRPFNFFLFPPEHPFNLGGNQDRTLERDLALSPGAIAFNRRYKMDFQKWIYHGVEYCNGPLERRMEAFLDKEANAEAAKKRLAADREISFATLSSAEEKAYFIQCEEMAKEFIKELATPEEEANRPKELMLPSTKSRTARETTQSYLEATYHPKLLVASRGRFPKKDLCLVRVSVDEMNKLRERQENQRSRQLLDFVGFRTIFKTMVESRKPIVGHNCLVDLLFMQTAFDEPLDLTSLAAYKKHLIKSFPLVFDTKAVAVNTEYFSEDRFDARSLEPLFTSLKEKPAEGVELPTFTLPLGFQSYEEATLIKARQINSGAHEAGYDAMMTGQVLLMLLAEAKKLPLSSASTSATAIASDGEKKEKKKESEKKAPIAEVVSTPPTHPRANKSSSPLFDEAAKVFGNYIHLHRSLYLLDVETVDSEREKIFEGGVSDVFTANKGVVLLTYDPLRIAAHHILESQILSLGFEGCRVLEVLPGIAVVTLTEKAIDAVAKRNNLAITSPSTAAAATAAAGTESGKPSPVASSASATTQYPFYENPLVVEAAVKEINAKFHPKIKAEVFVPFHYRKRDGSTIRELMSQEIGDKEDNMTLKEADECKNSVEGASVILGACSHPSIEEAFKGTPSPFSVLPPEVLVACQGGAGNHIVTPISPIAPEVFNVNAPSSSSSFSASTASTTTTQKRQFSDFHFSSATLAQQQSYNAAAAFTAASLGSFLTRSNVTSHVSSSSSSAAWNPRSLLRRFITKH